MTKLIKSLWRSFIRVDHNKGFENALLSGLSFVGCWLLFASQGWIITGGFFGVIGGVMLGVAIYHLCVDIWEA